MTDQIAGLPSDGTPTTWGGYVAKFCRGGAELRPVHAAGASCAVLLAVLQYFWLSEGSFSNIVFTVGVTLALIAALTLLTARLLFATVTVAAFLAVIVAASTVKQSVMSMVVHAYDLFFYFSSWSTVAFLWHDYRGYMIALLAATAGIAVAGFLAWRADGTRVDRRHTLAVLIACIAIAWTGAEAKGERRHMQFFFEDHYVSSFFASWGETLATLWNGQLLEAAPRDSHPAFALPASCTPARPPNIILIHEESIAPPGLFPGLAYDRSVDPLFRSDDGKTHTLRVETYGGASWLTEFSLLAGMSTQSFGGMRPFVQTFMQNGLKDTVPQALARCGYRNVVFYPLLRNFVSNDRFYTSIGLTEIFDSESQHADEANERDRFYFDNAMAEMKRHFASSDKPLFTYIQTMMAHWPYTEVYAPEEKVPGGGPGTNPEMSEYLRRVSLAKIDYDYFTAELKRRFPGQPFLIVHYGDHQPSATRTLLGFKAGAEAEDVTLPPDSIGFLTYYAAHGINYAVPPLPAVDVLDVAYLGSVVLDLAGLPLSDSHRERLRLLAACKGRYYDCADRSAILAFHRRLMNSGLVAAR